MSPSEQFQFCPRCAARQNDPANSAPFRCAQCGFLFYFNPAPATAAFVRDESGRVLFIRRAKDPGRGMLSIPGGFVDIGETVEEALRRELREEVNLEVGALEFFGTQPNVYHYQGVTYPLIDSFFVTRAMAIENATALDDVDSLHWLDAASVKLEDIAFPSVRAALKQFVELQAR